MNLSLHVTHPHRYTWYERDRIVSTNRMKATAKRTMNVAQPINETQNDLTFTSTLCANQFFTPQDIIIQNIYQNFISYSSHTGHNSQNHFSLLAFSNNAPYITRYSREQYPVGSSSGTRVGPSSPRFDPHKQYLLDNLQRLEYLLSFIHLSSDDLAELSLLPNYFWRTIRHIYKRQYHRAYDGSYTQLVRLARECDHPRHIWEEIVLVLFVLRHELPISRLFPANSHAPFLVKSSTLRERPYIPNFTLFVFLLYLHMFHVCCCSS
jgi:hypothetical protein